MYKLATLQEDRNRFDEAIAIDIRDQLRLLDRSDLDKVKEQDWQDYIEARLYDNVDDVEECIARFKFQFARILRELKEEKE
jgi:hypothetical protein